MSEVIINLNSPNFDYNGAILRNYIHTNLNSYTNINVSQTVAGDIIHDASNLFSNLSSLDKIDIYLKTKYITNVSNMFCSCANLNTIPNFDTSNVTDMAGMFANCYNLRSVPNFNTINVTNMYGIFSQYIPGEYNEEYEGNELRSIPNFDTSNVTNMQGAFYGCS